jgi:hypothetical protein
MACSSSLTGIAAGEVDITGKPLPDLDRLSQAASAV